MNKKLKKKDIIFWVALVCVIVAAIYIGFSLVPIKKHIKKTVSGVKLNSQNEETYEIVELTMDGYYYDYIFGLFNYMDYYRGNFKVSGTIEVSEPPIAHIFFHDDSLQPDKVKYGVGSYYTEHANYDVKKVSISKNGVFSQIFLEDWIGLGDDYAFPAESLNEAKAVKEALTGQINY